MSTSADATTGVEPSIAKATTTKHLLYDAPVSNNGARCRLILYKKGIPESEVTIVSPSELGGLKSDAYLELNPQGKMPLLVGMESKLNIPESDTICRYLLSSYNSIDEYAIPTFVPDSPVSNLIARYHDMYITTIQGCMYKPKPPFGIYGCRKDALRELLNQLQIINDMVVANNNQGDFPYLCGSEVSLADATLFPTMVFCQYILPKFDATILSDTNDDEGGLVDHIPTELNAWYHRVMEQDDDFRRVEEEIRTSLEKWDARDPPRWSTIWCAGVRDDVEPPTIFDKIVAGEIPATVVKEDDKILAFKDINPAAPAHVLVIPKERNGLSCIRKATPEHTELLGRLLVAAGEIANDTSLGFGDGARIVINDGPDGGQEVPHLHLHVLGGRSLTWPPG